MTAPIGQLMALSNPRKIGELFNLHETPPEATVALCRRYRDHINGRVWEPACGYGKIARVIVDECPDVDLICSDLVFRGFGYGGIDFTSFPVHLSDGRPKVITNPPFDLAVDFVRKAHELEAPFVALLLKAQFWNAKDRLALYRDHPPQACHPLTWRLDFHGLGRPVMDCQWVIWGDDVPFANDPLPKPILKEQANEILGHKT